MEPVTIVGTPVSPYVRKVLAVCELKGIAYRVDPITPFYGSDAFTALSPLRKIPVLIDGAVTLADSTVIAEYLEERQPEPSAYPAEIAPRARARWLEEFADTRLADVLVWRLFNRAVIAPAVWGAARDAAALARVVAEEIPPLMDLVEAEAPESGFRFGALSIADIAIAVFFRNARWARFEPDARRWPKAASWIARTTETPPLARLTRIADALARTPPLQHHAAAAALGLAVTAETLAVAAPRRGPMTA